METTLESYEDDRQRLSYSHPTWLLLRLRSFHRKQCERCVELFRLRSQRQSCDNVFTTANLADITDNESEVSR